MNDIVLVDIVDSSEHSFRKHLDVFEGELTLGEVVV